MSQELIYTSAPSGLKPGSKGFCTVAMTAGMSAGWVERLESLSAYRAVFPLGDPRADQNPRNYCHWRADVAGKGRSVLSYVAFAGADYSGRSNKLASHLVLEPAERAAGGPAWVLQQPGVIRTAWEGAPRTIPAGPTVPTGDRDPRPCDRWAAVRGDPGWAGVLAEAFVNDPAKPAYLVYAPGVDVLGLFEESLHLLPMARRWDVTFSTFFTDLPLNLACAWRAVIAGTPAAAEAARMGHRALVLDLTKPAGAPPGGAYADAARAGTGPVTSGAAARPAPPALRATASAPAADLDDSDIALAPITAEAASASLRGRPGATPVAFEDFDDERPARGRPAVRPRPSQPVIRNRGVRGSVYVASVAACIAGGAIAWETNNASMQKQLADVKAQLSDAQAGQQETGRRLNAVERERDVANAEKEESKQQLTATEAQSATARQKLLSTIEEHLRTIADLREERRNLRQQLRSTSGALPATTKVVPANPNPPVAEPEWAKVSDVSIPRDLDLVRMALPNDSKETSLPGNPLPANGGIRLIWEDGSSNLKNGLVTLTQYVSDGRETAMLQVRADVSNAFRAVTKTPLTISVTAGKITFDWAGDPSDSDKLRQTVRGLLAKCVLELRDHAGNPVSLYCFMEPTSIVRDYAYSLPSEIKATDQLFLEAKVPGAESKWDAAEMRLALTPKATGIPYYLTSSTAGMSRDLTCVWPREYIMCAQRLLNLRAALDVGLSAVAHNPSQYNDGSSPNIDFDALFSTYAQDTEILSRSDQKLTQAEMDALHTEKKLAEDRLAKVRSRLDTGIKNKQEWLNSANASFEVIVTLRNRVPVAKARVRVPRLPA